MYTGSDLNKIRKLMIYPLIALLGGTVLYAFSIKVWIWWIGAAIFQSADVAFMFH